MNTTPHVSVLIPTYNRKAELAELLEALTQQTFRDFETIIVNDCGESVVEVVELYPELRIKLLRTPTNVRHVHARNLGLASAEAEWILLCDDDDLLVPDHLERMIELSEEADLVYSDAEIVEYDYSEDKLVRLPTSRQLFAYRYDPEGMRVFSTFIPSGTLYRKRVHEEIGVFDAEMYHYWDWDFILRVMKNYRVRRSPAAGVLYAFSVNGDNLSGDHKHMRSYLDKLCAKHGLGDLPTKNFRLLLEEPEIKSREASSQVVWDGSPVVSRYTIKLRASN